MIRPREGLGLRKGYHSPQLNVEVRLNTNESPFQLPDGFYRRLAEVTQTLALNRYPDRSYFKVKEVLAEQCRVEPEMIFAANGSNEVIQSICLAYGGHGRKAMVIEPTYAMHSQIARHCGSEVDIFLREQPRNLGYAEFERNLTTSSPDMVFLCSPNNPTGESLDQKIIDLAISNDDLAVVLDQAYVDFASTPWRYISANNVLQSRTFSKAYALAGLRFGYLIASREVVEVLEEVVLPYHLDSMKQAAVLCATEFAGQVVEAHAEIIAQREKLIKELNALAVEAYPSEANFVLIDFGELDANSLWNRLVDKSILVRNCSGWPGLKNHLRVTVGNADENQRFIEALSELLR